MSSQNRNGFMQTESFKGYLDDLEMAISMKKPVCVIGEYDFRMSCIFGELSKTHGRKITKITVGGQLDMKSLIGNYCFSENHEGFEWKLGLLSLAVKEGHWLIIEGLRLSCKDTIMYLNSIVEDGVLHLSDRCERILINEEFRLFVVIDVRDSSSESKKELVRKTVSPWIVLFLNTYSRLDNEAILLSSCHELSVLVPFMITMYETIGLKDQFSMKRQIYIDDMIKIMMRIKKTLAFNRDLHMLEKNRNSVDIKLRKIMFKETISVLSASIVPLKERVEILMKVSDIIGLSVDDPGYYLATYSPIVKETDEEFIIGSSSIEKWVRKGGEEPASRKDKEFVYTPYNLRVLEKICDAIVLEEPLLLVGETGTGKTTSIQRLAEHLNVNLHVVNLHHYSEVEDLVGGYRSCSITGSLKSLKEQFDILFAKTFSSHKNMDFMSLVKSAYGKQQWKKLLKIFVHCTEISLKRYGEIGLCPKSQVLVDEWTRFQELCKDTKKQLDGDSTRKLFSFFEGILVKSLKHGHWVLLDEINLASTETLEILNNLISDKNGSVVLLDKGDTEPVVRHKNFRIFGCMNPATDISKRDLSAGIRRHFTEIYLDDIDMYPDDLKMIIRDKLAPLFQNLVDGVEVKGVKNHDNLSMFVELVHSLFYSIKDAINSNIILDGSGKKPHFSLRTLCRTFEILSSFRKYFDMQISFFESLMTTFIVQLDSKSKEHVTGLLLSLFKRHNMIVDMGKGMCVKSNYDRLSGYDVIEGYVVKRGCVSNRLDSSYILTPRVSYNIRSIARSLMASEHPILIQGPTSTGKTSVVEYLGKKLGYNVVRINNHENTDLSEYLGSFIYGSTGEIVFSYGVLVEALRHGYWVILDEINLAPSDVLESLNRLLDDNREIYIPDVDEWIRPHVGFRLFATMNPPCGKYGGRKLLSRAFRNRFIELFFEEFPENEVQHLLEKSRIDVPPSYSKKLAEVYHSLLRERVSVHNLFAGKHSIITLRDMFKWIGRNPATSYQELAENGYLVIAERSRSAENKQVIKAIIEKSLRVDIAENKIYEKAERYIEEFGSDTRLPFIVWTSHMKRLLYVILQCVENNEPVLLVGDTGCGKTTICEWISLVKSKPLISINCHQYTDVNDFLGQQKQVMDEKCNISRKRIKLSDTRTPIFRWRDGPLIECMKKGHHLLIDEISLAEDAILERLNSVLEPSRTITLLEGDITEDNSLERIIKASQGFQIFATMNPGGDFGKRELSSALRSRFTEIWVPPLNNTKDIRDIVWGTLKRGFVSENQLVNVVADSIMKFIKWVVERLSSKSPCLVSDIVIDVEEEIRLSTPSLTISVRDICSWVSFIVRLHLKIGVVRSFWHGAQMTFLDSLSMSGMFSTNLKSAEIKTESQNMLMVLCKDINTVSPEFNELDLWSLDYTKSCSFSMHGNLWGSEPFWIECGDQMGGLNVPYLLETPNVSENTMKILRALQLEKPILLEGDPGVGKTSLIYEIGQLTSHKVVRINFSEQTDIADLYGFEMPSSAGNDSDYGCSFEWKDGPFLSALKEGSWIILDEINLAPQQVLEGLNSALDHRGFIYIPELDKKFTFSKKTLRIFATQNPRSQGGARRGLPKSFLNRFSKVYVSTLSAGDIIPICARKFTNISEHVISGLVRLNQDILGYENGYFIRSKGGPWSYNLRDIFRCLELYLHIHPYAHMKYEDVRILAYSFWHTYVIKLRIHEDRSKIRFLFSEVFGYPDNHCADDEFFSSVSISNTYFRCGFALTDVDRLYGNLAVMHPHYKRNSFVVKQSSCIEGLIYAVQNRWLSILVGEFGSEKFAMVKFVADIMGKPLHVISLSSSSDTSDFLGNYEQASLHESYLKQWRQWLVEIQLFFNRLCVDDTRLKLLATRLFETRQPACEMEWKELLNVMETFRTEIPRKMEEDENLFTSDNIEELKFIIDEKMGVFECRLRDIYGVFLGLDRNGFVNPKGQFMWKDGILLEALDLGHWVLFDNANICPASVLDRLNSLFEPNPEIYVYEKSGPSGTEKTRYCAHPEFRAFMSIDPTQGELSRSMRNRGMEIYVDSSRSQPRDCDMSDKITCHIDCIEVFLNSVDESFLPGNTTVSFMFLINVVMKETNKRILPKDIISLGCWYCCLVNSKHHDGLSEEDALAFLIASFEKVFMVERSLLAVDNFDQLRDEFVLGLEKPLPLYVKYLKNELRSIQHVIRKMHFKDDTKVIQMKYIRGDVLDDMEMVDNNDNVQVDMYLKVHFSSFDDIFGLFSHDRIDYLYHTCDWMDDNDIGCLKTEKVGNVLNRHAVWLLYNILYIRHLDSVVGKLVNAKHEIDSCVTSKLLFKNMTVVVTNLLELDRHGSSHQSRLVECMIYILIMAEHLDKDNMGLTMECRVFTMFKYYSVLLVAFKDLSKHSRVSLLEKVGFVFHKSVTGYERNCSVNTVKCYWHDFLVYQHRYLQSPSSKLSAYLGGDGRDGVFIPTHPNHLRDDKLSYEYRELEVTDMLLKDLKFSSRLEDDILDSISKNLEYYYGLFELKFIGDGDASKKLSKLLGFVRSLNDAGTIDKDYISLESLIKCMDKQDDENHTAVCSILVELIYYYKRMSNLLDRVSNIGSPLFSTIDVLQNILELLFEKLDTASFHDIEMCLFILRCIHDIPVCENIDVGSLFNDKFVFRVYERFVIQLSSERVRGFEISNDFEVIDNSIVVFGNRIKDEMYLIPFCELVETKLVDGKLEHEPVRTEETDDYVGLSIKYSIMLLLSYYPLDYNHPEDIDNYEKYCELMYNKRMLLEAKAYMDMSCMTNSTFLAKNVLDYENKLMRYNKVLHDMRSLHKTKTSRNTKDVVDSFNKFVCMNFDDIKLKQMMSNVFDPTIYELLLNNVNDYIMLLEASVVGCFDSLMNPILLSLYNIRFCYEYIARRTYYDISSTKKRSKTYSFVERCMRRSLTSKITLDDQDIAESLLDYMKTWGREEVSRFGSVFEETCLVYRKSLTTCNITPNTFSRLYHLLRENNLNHILRHSKLFLLFSIYSLSNFDSCADENKRKRYSIVDAIRTLKNIHLNMVGMLKELPENTIIQNILAEINKLISLSVSKTRLKGFIDGLENIISLCEELQQIMSLDSSTKGNIDELFKKTVEARRFELEMLDTKLDRIIEEYQKEEGSRQIRDIFLTSFETVDQSKSFDELRNRIDSYILDLGIGGFSHRLNLVDSLYYLLQSSEKFHSPEGADVLKKINSICNYYKVYELGIECYIEEKNTKFKEEIGCFIKTIKWKEHGSYLLKQNRLKYTSKVKRHTSKFQTMLDLKVKDFIGGVWKNSDFNRSVDDIISSFHQNSPLSSEVAFESNRESDMCVFKNLHIKIREFVGAYINRIKTLRRIIMKGKCNNEKLYSLRNAKNSEDIDRKIQNNIGYCNSLRERLVSDYIKDTKFLGSQKCNITNPMGYYLDHLGNTNKLEASLWIEESLFAIIDQSGRFLVRSLHLLRYFNEGCSTVSEGISYEKKQKLECVSKRLISIDLANNALLERITDNYVVFEKYNKKFFHFVQKGESNGFEHMVCLSSKTGVFIEAHNDMVECLNIMNEGVLCVNEEDSPELHRLYTTCWSEVKSVFATILADGHIDSSDVAIIYEQDWYKFIRLFETSVVETISHCRDEVGNGPVNSMILSVMEDVHKHIRGYYSVSKGDAPQKTDLDVSKEWDYIDELLSRLSSYREYIISSMEERDTCTEGGDSQRRSNMSLFGRTINKTSEYYNSVLSSSMFIEIYDGLCRIFKNVGWTDNTHLTTLSGRLSKVYLALKQLSSIVNELFKDYVLYVHAISEYSFIQCNILSILFNSGFTSLVPSCCLDDGGKSTNELDLQEGGMGLSEGQGNENISNELEHQEQIEGLEEDEDENNEKPEDLKEKEKETNGDAVDLDDDFDGDICEDDNNIEHERNEDDTSDIVEPPEGKIDSNENDPEEGENKGELQETVGDIQSKDENKIENDLWDTTSNPDHQNGLDSGSGNDDCDYSDLDLTHLDNVQDSDGEEGSDETMVENQYVSDHDEETGDLNGEESGKDESQSVDQENIDRDKVDNQLGNNSDNLDINYRSGDNIGGFDDRLMNEDEDNSNNQEIRCGSYRTETDGPESFQSKNNNKENRSETDNFMSFENHDIGNKNEPYYELGVERNVKDVDEGVDESHDSEDRSKSIDYTVNNGKNNIQVLSFTDGKGNDQDTESNQKNKESGLFEERSDSRMKSDIIEKSNPSKNIRQERNETTFNENLSLSSKHADNTKENVGYDMNHVSTSERNRVDPEHCVSKHNTDVLERYDVRTFEDDNRHCSWKHYIDKTYESSLELTEYLRLMLEPTLVGKLEGNYKSGKRINMKKIISYIASDYRKDKIWMKRTKPSKRDYQILISIDESSSMGFSGAGPLAFEALALISQSLIRLEAGDLSIAGFGEGVHLYKPFSGQEGPGSDHFGDLIVESMSFKHKRTDIISLFKDSLVWFKQASQLSYNNNKSAIHQIHFVLSDGVFDNVLLTRKHVNESFENGILVVFLILDPRPKERSILDMKSISYSSDSQGNVHLNMGRYLDEFPSEYYVVVRDINTLPGVVSTAIGEWLEMLRHNNK